jgi:hypothetical protein
VSTQSSLITNAKYTAMVLKDLSAVYQPHPGQLLMGRAVFGDKVQYIGGENGRNWGKTDFLGYILYRWALLHEGEQFYYCAPYYNQAAELVWFSGRLPGFLKDFEKKYIDHIYDTDKRILFKNGSFIKLLGSDNHQTSRGLKPKGVGYDEYKDFDIRFDEGMRPNLIAKKAQLVIIGTPPKEDDHFFCKTMDDFKVRKNARYFNQPTHVNPHIDKEWIKDEEDSYRRRGDYAEFQREYLAMRVRGGKGAIFPMLELPPVDPSEKSYPMSPNPLPLYKGVSKHMIPYGKILKEIHKRPKDWEFYDIYDAGTVTCFASLLICINRFDRRVICMDEIYERDQMKTTTDQIYPLALEKMEEINWRDDEWLGSYDNAASWFATEVMHLYSRHLVPCEKDIQKKEEKLGLIKDMMMYPGHPLFQMTDRCQGLAYEMSNYYKDENGKIPKKNDHLLDCLRYGLNLANYTRIEVQRRVVDEEERRIFKLNKENIYEPSDDDPDNITVSEQFEEILRRAY